MTDRANQTDSPYRTGPRVGDELLPPVEPPSARFLIQLFVVPALIVFVIVLVWLGVSWLVRQTMMGPDQLVQGLEQGPSIARWQRASDLAFMLANDQYAAVRQNRELATDVARILDRKIHEAVQKGGMDDHEIEFRYYLTQALGQFDVPEGTDVLLKAAQTKRDPAEWRVCYSAIQALARRVELNVEGINRAEIETALLRFAGDEDGSIRSACAYALGKLGTPAAIQRLEAMVDDPDAETRFNAAVALAHRGNGKAAETLAEMLDPEVLSGLPEAPRVPGQESDRGAIVDTAITAAHALAQKNPQAHLTAVTEALQRLSTSDGDTLRRAQLPPRVASDASRAMDSLKSH